MFETDGDELLESAAEVLEEKGWTRGVLTHPEGAHCALGAIGYARWGEQFDTVALHNSDGAYGMLRKDAKTAAAVNNLANQVRALRGWAPIPQDHPWHDASADQQVVYHWNDLGNKRTVVQGFRSLLGAVREKRNKVIDATVAAIKKPRVEHVKADAAEPVRQEERA